MFILNFAKKQIKNNWRKNGKRRKEIQSKTNN